MEQPAQQQAIGLESKTNSKKESENTSKKKNADVHEKSIMPLKVRMLNRGFQCVISVWILFSRICLLFLSCFRFVTWNECFLVIDFV